MTEKKAFIIVNTGSPECNIPSIKTFLKLFLSDKHVIRMPKVFWYPILYGIILRKRPVILLKKYQEIAEELGITINTIRTQVSRGYKKLRDILSEEVDSSVLFFMFLKNK